MGDFMTNMTQVIANSPQVGSLVGGQLAAVEEAQRQAWLDESQRQQETLRHTVLAAEKAGRVAPTNPDGRQREETRRERKARLKAERERRQLAERAARMARAERTTDRGSPCAQAPSDSKLVIDVCV